MDYSEAQKIARQIMEKAEKKAEAHASSLGDETGSDDWRIDKANYMVGFLGAVLAEAIANNSKKRLNDILKF